MRISDWSSDVCSSDLHSRAIMATSTQKLKVLSVSAADYGGGAEKIAMALFEALRNQGHKSWMAVGQRRHDHPDTLRLPDARWRDAALGRLGPMCDSLWGAERVQRKDEPPTNTLVVLSRFRRR